jgi:hypothetical protein
MFNVHLILAAYFLVLPSLITAILPFILYDAESQRSISSTDSSLEQHRFHPFIIPTIAFLTWILGTLAFIFFMVFYTRIRAYFILALLCIFSVLSLVSAGNNSTPKIHNATGDESGRSSTGPTTLNLDNWAFVVLVTGIYALSRPRVPRILVIFVTVFTSVTLALSLLAYYLSENTAITHSEASWAIIRKELEIDSYIFWFVVLPYTILISILGRKMRPILFFVAATLFGGALAAGDPPIPTAITHETILGSTGLIDSAFAVAILMWAIAAMVFIWGGVLAIEEGRWDPNSLGVGNASPSSVPTSSWVISFLLLLWVVLWLVLREQHQSFLPRD